LWAQGETNDCFKGQDDESCPCFLDSRLPGANDLDFIWCYIIKMNLELKKYYEELGIGSVHFLANRLVACEQAQLQDLEVVDIDFAGRPFVLTRPAAMAWKKICEAASSENVILNPASGFRSYLYQKKLIESQLLKGRTLNEILTFNAIPGFSEHHTGCAVDICADPSIPEAVFHETETFRWMLENAARFNFRLSYPRDNQYGMIFEPWHWLFCP
jgi:D-alanyl-D-alanine carboxypeptidase